jgi:hypothetical protein
MSLQALKLKSNTIHSNQSENGFSLSGGHRTTSYIGKSMRNSPNGTRYKGIYPVNFSQTKGVISNSTMCNQIIELRGNSPAQQKSVGNNRSMIYSRNKWIKGVYPNNWVQNVKEISYEEYLKQLKIKEECGNRKNIPTQGGEECCECEEALPRSQVDLYYRPLEKLKKCNAGVVKHYDPFTMSYALYNLFLQKQCIDMDSDKNKHPFPKYRTNTGVLNTKLISCGAISSELPVESVSRVNYPIILLKGRSPIYLNLSTPYEELGAIAYDTTDGILTDKIEIISDDIVTANNGIYKVVYSVTNSRGNTSTVSRTVIVNTEYYVSTGSGGSFTFTNPFYPSLQSQSLNQYEQQDEQNYHSGGPGPLDQPSGYPIITPRNYGPSYTHNIGTDYQDFGATAVDENGVDITDRIQTTSNVDSYAIGDYQVIYSVTDDQSRTSTVTRIVLVRP